MRNFNKGKRQVNSEGKELPPTLSTFDLKKASHAAQRVQFCRNKEGYVCE